MTKEELLQLLDALREGISEDDSFAGELSYSLRRDGTYRIQGTIRVNNRLGQGGVIIYDDPVWDDQVFPLPSMVNR